MANGAAAACRLLAIACLASILLAAQAGKILIATTPIGKSHMMNLKKIAKEVEQRGNTVMVRPAVNCIAKASQTASDQCVKGTQQQGGA